MFPSAPLISILYTNTVVAILVKQYVAMKHFSDIPSYFDACLNVTTQNEKNTKSSTLGPPRTTALFLQLGLLEATFARKVYRQKVPRSELCEFIQNQLPNSGDMSSHVQKPGKSPSGWHL